MTRDEIAKIASDAGFGGQQRNTLAIKLERFATLVEQMTKTDAERYRWLRDNWTSIVSHMDSPFEIRFEVMPSKWGHFGTEVIDAAIDDAIRANSNIKDKP